MCELCKDTGWVHYTKDDKDYARRCECQEIIDAENRLKKSGISEEFLKKSFDNYNDRDKIPLHIAKDKAMKYCERFQEIRHERFNSILFMGQVGSGKTHLSMAICNTLMNEQKTPVLYMPYREAILKIKQSVKDEIINHRYLNNAPMIVSTELMPNQLLNYDEGVMSRLIEMSRDYMVEIKGQEYNYRLNGGR